jgi:molybdopterin converting factor small subunit
MRSTKKIRVEVRLFAYLRRYLPSDANGRCARWETAASDVGAVAVELGIPSSAVGVVLLNGRHADTDTRLHDGDVVSFFPPIAGG